MKRTPRSKKVLYPNLASSNSTVKIILLDIETSPNLAYVWGKYQQDVIEYEHEWDLLCWTVKDLEGESRTRALCDVKNERELVQELWNEFDRADIIIAHNGDDFDIKKSNAKFSFYRLPPPSPYRTIDTLKVARKYFGFNSNKLNDLGQFLHLGTKVETGGFKTWRGCMEGDSESWRLMKKYNAQDVLLLEKVYLHFRPWITNHPNLSLYCDGFICPKCKSDNIRREGCRFSQTRKFQRYQCQDCLGWSRSPVSEPRKEELLV